MSVKSTFRVALARQEDDQVVFAAGCLIDTRPKRERIQPPQLAADAGFAGLTETQMGILRLEEVVPKNLGKQIPQARVVDPRHALVPQAEREGGGGGGVREQLRWSCLFPANAR